MAVIGDGEETMVRLFMLDDATFDAVGERVSAFLADLTRDLPVRAEYHDGFDVTDFDG